MRRCPRGCSDSRRGRRFGDEAEVDESSLLRAGSAAPTRCGRLAPIRACGANNEVLEILALEYGKEVLGPQLVNARRVVMTHARPIDHALEARPVGDVGAQDDMSLTFGFFIGTRGLDLLEPSRPAPETSVQKAHDQITRRAPPVLVESSQHPPPGTYRSASLARSCAWRQMGPEDHWAGNESTALLRWRTTSFPCGRCCHQIRRGQRDVRRDRACPPGSNPTPR